MSQQSASRLAEAALFKRIEEGDSLAKWELFARQQRMVKRSAGIYSNGDPLLRDWLLSEAEVALEKAFASYNHTLERKGTFSDWSYKYLGMHFSAIVRKVARIEGYAEARNHMPPTDASDTGSNGRKDGAKFHHGSEPQSVDRDESLPEFLNESTGQLARMLATGFSASEARAALGLTEGEYRKKVAVIKKKLEPGA